VILIRHPRRPQGVIASEAKQSSKLAGRRGAWDCFVASLLAKTALLL
jgi:hypothetical protein